MSSYTSAFKAFLPLFLAVCGAVLIEAACYTLVPRRLALLQSPLLHMTYRTPILRERLLTVVKLGRVNELPGTIIQIGDSTGLVGVRPSIVDTYLPSGLKLLNLSLQVPAQYRGFEAAAERSLTDHPDAKYLMLMATPFNIGRDDPGIGKVLWRDYASLRPWRWFPSLSMRAFVTNLVYYGVISSSGVYDAPHSAPPGVSDVAFVLADLLGATDGWLDLEMPFIQGMPQCLMLGYESQLLRDHLERIYAVAARHQVRMILVVGPVRCQPSPDSDRLRRDVEQFLSAHSDVQMPMPIIDIIAPELLTDDVHLSRRGYEVYSHRLGAALRDLLAKAAHEDAHAPSSGP